MAQKQVFYPWLGELSYSIKTVVQNTLTAQLIQLQGSLINNFYRNTQLIIFTFQNWFSVKRKNSKISDAFSGVENNPKRNIKASEINQNKLIPNDKFYLELCYMQYTKLGVLGHFAHGVFWRMDIRTFWVQKIKQENLAKFTKILNYIKSSCIIFCVKLF